MIKSLIKNVFQTAGFQVEWRDRLAESIPANHERSPFLPKVYKQSLRRFLYFHDMVQRASRVEGDIVECGVSIGHGLLLFLLLSEIEGIERNVYGFDSFEGFPAPTAEDGSTHAYQGYYASPPEIVLKVLRDGRVSEEVIRDWVRLRKGFFEATLPSYDGRIALLHLDCDLYTSYKVALEHLYDKVVPGGVIMFDEYGAKEFPGAKEAVDEFFADKPERVEQHRMGKWFTQKVGQ